MGDAQRDAPRQTLLGQAVVDGAPAVAEDRDEDVVEAEKAGEREILGGRMAGPHQRDEGVAVKGLDEEADCRQRPLDGEGQVHFAPQHALQHGGGERDDGDVQARCFAGKPAHEMRQEQERLVIGRGD